MVATERIFAMPAFEGLKVIRRHLLQVPEMALVDIVIAIQATEADAASLDLEASCVLHELVDHCDIDSQEFYQHCIRGVVLSRFPIWVKTIKYGRRIFADKLDKDQQTLFESAGLLADPASPSVVTWWDLIGHEIKLETDLEKMRQARAAEKLSIDFERDRLKHLGLNAEPLWVALDNNQAGYDVLSYEPGTPEKINKLIEVKSTIASPLRFYVTRNEWKHALKYKDAYQFHIWDMQKTPPMLYVRTVDEVAIHIPTDGGKGKWSNAEIPVGA